MKYEILRNSEFDTAARYNKIWVGLFWKMW